MKFTVTWKPSAERELTRIWMDSRQRSALTASVSRLEAALLRAPLESGESRTDSVRVVFDYPLAITFKVSVEDLRVTVLNVWTAE
jgi:mRNA-degrading endonuclease RelE of RelBE toxin-antitoxin system